MLDRKANETDLQYHRRLVYGKLIDRTLADVDFSELAPLLYDGEYNSHSARKMMYGSCKTLQLLDKEAEQRVSSSDIIGEIDAKKIELAKERQRFFDQRTAFNKVVRERAREEELNDIIVRTIENGMLPSFHYVPREIQPSDNDLLVSLNDIHYGAVVDNYWCKYNSDIFVDMLTDYLDRILEIARTHRSEGCIVWMNGDAISGSIHHSLAVSNKENLIEQVTGVSELIAGFLAALSPHFSYVKFISVAGNHSRLDTKDRAIRQERLDDLVEWYLKARMQSFDNVEIGCEKIDCSMYLVEIRGKTYLGIHGDLDSSPASIQSLQQMAGKPIYAVLLGHMHHNAMNVIQGIRMVMAGSFQGMDDYCVSKRIFGKPEQLVCVCDAGGIRCSYDIDLSRN